MISNFDFVGMEKIVERMFAVDATKSSVSASSLSKVRTCTESGLWIAFHRTLKTFKLSSQLPNEIQHKNRFAGSGV